MAIMLGLITWLRWNISWPVVLSKTECSRPPNSGRQVTLRYSFSRNRALYVRSTFVRDRWSCMV